MVKNQDAYHALAAEIEKIVPRYDRLLKDVANLTENPQFSSTMPYVRGGITKIFRKLQESKVLLEGLKNATLEYGSYKRNPRDWYLFLLATTLINATGRPHIEELATLLEAAQSAHNERRHSLDVGTLTKRIQRWRKYLGAKVIGGRTMFRMSGSRSKSPHVESKGEPIPF